MEKNLMGISINKSLPAESMIILNITGRETFTNVRGFSVGILLRERKKMEKREEIQSDNSREPKLRREVRWSSMNSGKPNFSDDTDRPEEIHSDVSDGRTDKGSNVSGRDQT